MSKEQDKEQNKEFSPYEQSPKDIEDFEVLRQQGKGQLSQAVKNANLMLVHASEQGLKIEQDLIEHVIKAKYLESRDKWTEGDEVDFWRTFRDISQAIQPVTIESILAANTLLKPSEWQSKFLGKKSRTLTRKAVHRYVRGALFSLGLMLVIQVYSLIGTTVLHNIENSDAKITDLENQIALQQELKNFQKSIAFELQKDLVAEQREKNIELLAKWLRPIDYLLFNKPADLSIFRLEKSKRLDKRTYDQINDVGVRVIQAAQHPILIIGAYILPLLYGLLGAYAYILRVLFEEIRTITYSMDSDIRYILRINLGALAGLMVGLFNVTVNFSPLAIAFVAGYSIEFLFMAIDRLIDSVNKVKTVPQESAKK